MVAASLSAFSRDAQAIPGASAKVDRLAALEVQPAIERLLSDKLAALGEVVAQQQREVSRLVVPAVQANRSPMYASMGAEAGQGTVARIRATFSRAADSEFPAMYDAVATELERRLGELFERVVAELRAVHGLVLHEVRVLCSGLWEQLKGAPDGVHRDSLAAALALIDNDFARARTQLFSHVHFRSAELRLAAQVAPAAPALDGDESAPPACAVRESGKQEEQDDGEHEEQAEEEEEELNKKRPRDDNDPEAPAQLTSATPSKRANECEVD